MTYKPDDPQITAPGGCQVVRVAHIVPYLRSRLSYIGPWPGAFRYPAQQNQSSGHGVHRGAVTAERGQSAKPKSGLPAANSAPFIAVAVWYVSGSRTGHRS